ncbi:MAG: hypothetical protein LAO30_00675 [Acidobacteriia bacterium]|nr:hypothetical protein [Terriglobia bacterium]
MPKRLVLIAILSLLTSVSAASTIAGTVMNLSSNKPSSGDQVILYRVDQTMHEVARAKSDAQGAFQFERPAGSRYLVAVFHQNVSYHTPLLAGSEPITVSVYNAVPRLAVVHEASNTLFPRLEGPRLNITEFFEVSNPSNPPRTLSAPFSFQLPKGSVLDSAAVQPPGTLPFLLGASACGPRDQYCIAYPIRPGSTKIRVLYHLPYDGQVSITKPVLHSVEQVALIVPEALRFEAIAPSIFWNRGEQNGLSTYVAASLHSGQSLTFSLSPAGHAAGTETKATTSAQRDMPLYDAAFTGTPLAHIVGAPEPAVPLPAGKHFLAWTILVGALVGALFLASSVFARTYRSSVPRDRDLPRPEANQRFICQRA